MNRKQNLLGFLALTLAQIFVGSTVVIGKHVISAMPMNIFLSIRFLVSTLLLLAIWMVFSKKTTMPWHPTGKLNIKDWGLLILQGFLGGFIFNTVFVFGLQYTTATSAGIIGSTVPVIIAISAFLILKEPLSSRNIIAIVLATLGILTIGLNNGASEIGHGTLIGDLLILLAMFPEAWFSIIGKALSKRITPLFNAVVCNFTTLLLLIPLAVLDVARIEGALFQDNMILMLSAFSGITNLLFFCLWPIGLVHVTASKAAIFTGVMPVSTTIMAIGFLHESFTLYDGVGMLLVITAIMIGARAKHQVDPAQESDPALYHTIKASGQNPTPV